MYQYKMKLLLISFILSLSSLVLIPFASGFAAESYSYAECWGNHPDYLIYNCCSNASNVGWVETFSSTSICSKKNMKDASTCTSNSNILATTTPLSVFCASQGFSEICFDHDKPDSGNCKQLSLQSNPSAD